MSTSLNLWEYTYYWRYCPQGHVLYVGRHPYLIFRQGYVLYVGRHPYLVFRQGHVLYVGRHPYVVFRQGYVLYVANRDMSSMLTTEICPLCCQQRYILYVGHHPHLVLSTGICPLCCQQRYFLYVDNRDMSSMLPTEICPLCCQQRYVLHVGHHPYLVLSIGICPLCWPPHGRLRWAVSGRPSADRSSQAEAHNLPTDAHDLTLLSMQL